MVTSHVDARVEFFVSPAGPITETVTVPVESVQSAVLPNETQFYWFDDTKLAWRTGRTQGGPVDKMALRQLGAMEDHYPCRFPNSEDRLIPISELQVRWDRPLDDPTDLIAARVSESAYFVSARQRLGGFLARQRRAFAGLHGLSTSAIQYHPHQVAIIRRVLADPVPRYVLADEVGLGKTIEAGVLIKQHVLERGESAAVQVVVPPHLENQWRSELASKFFLDDDEQVAILTESSLDEPGATGTMLVVDEAHHASRWAFSDERGLRARYEELARRAQRAESVLLLSATPVLNEEDGFLAMLHLIDPQGHPLEDREAFRTRVRGRQAVANAIADLTDDAAEFFLEDVLGELREQFDGDDQLLSHCAAVERLVSEDEASAERVAAIRALRTYVSETYRLHRRLLRTRRGDPSVVDLLPVRQGFELLPQEDEARAVAASFLEDWRSAIPAEGATKASKDAFSGFVGASFSHPAVLLRQMKTRRDALRHGEVEPAFTTEATLLQDFEKALETCLADGEPRANALAAWCEQEDRRAIVFVDDATVADRVCDELSKGWGPESVVRSKAGNDESIRQFVNGDARALVVDRESEEGLNLQGARKVGLFLYDLPLSPTRIEQRIGRVDRLEGINRLTFYGFEPVGDYEHALLTLVRDTARVFERSIAPLQYSLNLAVQSIRSRLLSYGPTAITDVAKELREDPKHSLDSELSKIQAQEALDSFERNEDREAEFAEALIEAGDESCEHGRDALRSWLGSALHFDFRGGEEFHVVHRQPGRFTKWPTLLSLGETLRRFAQHIDPEAREDRFELPLGPFTFDPELAAETGAGFLGVGHPFLLAVERQLQADVRGVAWAFWRHSHAWTRDEPGIFVSFDFVVELDLDVADNAFAENRGGAATALRVTADAIFAPIRQTVWVDLDSGPVTDDDVLAELGQRYGSHEGGKDTNLRPERWPKVDEVRPTSDWAKSISRARQAAEQTVRSDKAVTGAQERAREELRARLERAESVLLSRTSRLTGAAVEAERFVLEKERNLNRALAAAVDALRVRVDAAGVIVLASEPFSE